jgi:hypothetical protein
MLGEAVESCNALRPWATRPTLPSAKCARSRRDGAASGVVRRCADEESPTGMSVAVAPCSTHNGATTFVTVFMSSSTKQSIRGTLCQSQDKRNFKVQAWNPAVQGGPWPPDAESE